MSESPDGFSVAATRQYGAKSFAETVCAEVMVVSGIESEAKLSHDAAKAGATLSTVATNIEGDMAIDWI
jgi:hypothetical protein